MTTKSDYRNSRRRGEPTLGKLRLPLGMETGASIMEVALIAPVLMVMLFGMVDLGRWMYLAVEVSSAARAGVQYGAQNRATAVDSAGIQQAAVNDTPYIAGLTVTPTTICQCSGTPGTNVACSLASCTGSAQLGLFLKVTTSAQYKPWILYPSVASSVTVNGHATMEVGR
jgi:Flp pilus assembly protein TadG